jgi:hypothetical protein
MWDGFSNRPRAPFEKPLHPGSKREYRPDVGGGDVTARIRIAAAGPVDVGQVTRCTAGATVATLICFAQLGMLAAMLLLCHREWGWFAVAALLSCLLIVLARVIDLRSRRNARDRQAVPIPPDVLKAAQERFATEGTPAPADEDTRVRSLWGEQLPRFRPADRQPGRGSGNTCS